MKKTLAIIFGLLLAFVLAGCQQTLPTDPVPTAGYPTETGPTDPVPTESYPAEVYPAGNGREQGTARMRVILYVDYNMIQYADIIGSVGQEGFLYLYNADTKEITQLCDATHECYCPIIGHVFFSSNGGQLTHYVMDTGERELLYTAKNGHIRDVYYFNADENPVLYLLDGPTLLRYDLLSGETNWIGEFEEATNVRVSPANPDLLAMDGFDPFGWLFLNIKTGESVYAESNNADRTFYEDGILPEAEPPGGVHPNPEGTRPSD